MQDTWLFRLRRGAFRDSSEKTHRKVYVCCEAVLVDLPADSSTPVPVTCSPSEPESVALAPRRSESLDETVEGEEG